MLVVLHIMWKKKVNFPSLSMKRIFQFIYKTLWNDKEPFVVVVADFCCAEDARRLHKTLHPW